jgi:hypothetical protein
MSRLGGFIGSIVADRIEEDMLPAGKRAQREIAREKARNKEKEYWESQRGMTVWNYLTHTGQYRELEPWWRW